MAVKRFRKIAGRGSLGDINWGASGRSLKVLKEELAELGKHIGKRVLLTGGGGPGGSMATLQAAQIVKQGYARGKPGLKVTLTNIDAKYGGYAPYPYAWVRLKSGKEVFRKIKPEPFEPWIDSWQISVPATRNPLTVEKIRDMLSWAKVGNSLILKGGGVIFAKWDPDVTARELPKGYVYVYGVPTGKMFHYYNWSAWKKRIWDTYRVEPPSSYTVNPKPRHRVRFVDVPMGRLLSHPGTAKPVSRKRAIKYGLPVMAMDY